MMGANIVKMYSKLLMPMGTMVANATFVLISSSESPRPVKNRNRDTVGQKTVPMFGCFAKIEVEKIKKIRQ